MSRWDHHPPCPCGCGELSDECAGPQPNPLGALRISERPQPNPYHPNRDDNDAS